MCSDSDPEEVLMQRDRSRELEVDTGPLRGIISEFQRGPEDEAQDIIKSECTYEDMIVVDGQDRDRELEGDDEDPDESGRTGEAPPLVLGPPEQEVAESQK